jgi:hypothetical protein
MNERMAELFGQAGISDSINEEFGIEYLAQLIVRECAQVCLSQRDPANLNYKPSVKFAEAVKHHFGVKE